ncbi:MAG TPA: NUDIX domain-containing protein, partial [Ktedonobacterales bacterium]|nr:NUDIX domain-containing protein [Ktedonobacterales bacterium]
MGEADQQSGDAKARFRIGVFAVIERDGRYLLARRRDIGWWNLAGGGLEYGEAVEEGLARE